MRSKNQAKTNTNSVNLSLRKSFLNETSPLSTSKRPQIEISESFVKKRKILVLGAPGVGKSAIILRFKDDIFKNEYMPTIQETYKKEFKFNNEKVELEIIDLDGQNEFSLFSSNKFSLGINGFIFCYSVENQYSFNLIKIINAKLRSLVGDHVPKILIANKSDLSHKRLISSEQGKELARDLNATFLECSAKNGQNIQLVFQSILIEINKFETDVDLKTYTCARLLRFVLRHINRIIVLNYILSIIAFVSKP